MRRAAETLRKRGVFRVEGFVSHKGGKARYFRKDGGEVLLLEDLEVEWAEGLLLQAIFCFARGLAAFHADLEADHIEMGTKSWRKTASLEDLARAVAPERFMGWLERALEAEEPQPLVGFRPDGLVLSFIGTTEMRAPRALESYFLPLPPEVLEEAKGGRVGVNLEDGKPALHLGEKILTLPLEKLSLL